MDGTEQVLAQSGLHNIGRTTRAHAGVQIVGILVHGQKNNLGAAARIPQLMGDIDPAYVAQGNIEDDDVWAESQIFPDHSSPVRYDANDLVALLFFEHRGDVFENRGIIVAEKYGCALHNFFFEGPAPQKGPVICAIAAIEMWLHGRVTQRYYCPSPVSATVKTYGGDGALDSPN
jgi:hypothetical protein